MVRTDPYTPDRYYFECLDCLHRLTTTETKQRCPHCNGRLQNLAIPRE